MPEKKILMDGNRALIYTLVENDLADEYLLCVCLIIPGNGNR